MDPRTRNATLAGLRSGAMLALVLSSIALISVLGLISGCGHQPRPWKTDPQGLTAPYAPGRDVVWVVAPTNNESGVSVVDALRVADALVNAIQETEGISAVPLNRTLNAMQAAGLPRIETAAQATALARRMQADAVLVATITAWQPYEPPSIGLSVALFGRSDAMGVIDLTGLDPRSLSRASSDADPHGLRHDPSLPLAVIALHLDGANGAVRADLRRYADGRADPNSATGWQGYLTAMSRFERYAAFTAVRELLESEASRLIVQAQRREAIRETRNNSHSSHNKQGNLVGKERVLAPLGER